MDIEELCIPKKELSKEETEFIRNITDKIYSEFQKNNALSDDYLERLIYIYKKMKMKFFSKYSYDFNNMIVEEIRCEKILKNINKTQKVDNSISKKEYYIARKSTDDIYDVFKGRKKLSKIQREFLIDAYKTFGQVFFKKYSIEFMLIAKNDIVFSSNTKKSTGNNNYSYQGKRKKKKDRKKDITYYQPVSKYAYLSYRQVPNKSGIKIYHY